jgi:sulfur carrier protein ThiS
VGYCPFFLKSFPSGMFKKPAHKTTTHPMKLILPDQEVLILEHDPAPVEQILLEQGINPLEVIVTRNKKMMSEDTVVEADDEIRIIRIAHGG